MPEASSNPFHSRDSVANTLLVAISLSLVCSVLVASTAILLKPMQQRNEDLYRQQIILDVAGLYEADGDIDALFAGIETKMIELATGQYSDAVSAEDFDALEAAKDADLGIEIPAERDTANIRRRARLSPVYLVRHESELSQIILPVYGPGLWSTMRGFLSLGPDGSTVRGLRFYEHAETPGLGDQIDKADWRTRWIGKQVFGSGGESRIEVVRGSVDQDSNEAIHQVDGISGATLTGRGVTNLVRYWTGPHGFGPFLERIRAEAADND
ncbi:MAG: Na(+)-translocating NADH-quinone reductase subunit C [Woeseiaceae bacterium]